MVAELAIREKEPVEVCISKLDTGVCHTCIEMALVQL